MSKDKKPVKLETFYRVVRHSSYLYEIKAVDIDVNSAVERSMATPDVRENLIAKLMRLLWG